MWMTAHTPLFALLAFYTLIICHSSTISFYTNRSEHLLRRKDPSLYDRIMRIRESLHNNNHTPFCFGWNYDAVVGQYIDNRWKRYDQGDPMMLPFMCFSTSSFGNYFGFYLYNLGCAMHIRTNFATVYQEYEYLHYQSTYQILSSKEYAQLPTPGDRAKYQEYIRSHPLHLFFHLLPTIIVHPKPNPYQMARKIAQKDCQCRSFCWERAESFQHIYRHKWIGRIIHSAVSKYVKATHGKEIGTILQGHDVIMNNLSIIEDFRIDNGGLEKARQHPVHKHFAEMFNATKKPYMKMFLPLVPDIIIQYRCGDNLNLGKGYGLMPFSTYSKPSILRHIPNENTIRYIYIITESPARSKFLTPCLTCCLDILKALQKKLSSDFPQALIVLKRGGDMFLD